MWGEDGVLGGSAGAQAGGLGPWPYLIRFDRALSTMLAASSRAVPGM